MLPYIILLLISVISLFFPEKRWAKVLSLGSIFIISAFRGENVGTDTYGYLHDFRTDIESSFDMIGTNAEFITNGIVRLIISLGLPGRFIVLFYSVVTIGLIPAISKRFCISPVYLSFLFLTGPFVVSLNICRQVAATMIIALATTYIYEKEVKKSLFFFILVIIAAGIHATSVVFIILYLLRFLRVKYRLTVVFVLFSILFGYTGIIDVSTIMNGLMSYAGMYELYYGDIFGSQNANLSLFGLIVPIAIVGVKLYLVRNIDIQYLPLYSFALCVPLFFKGADTMVGRMLLIFEVVSGFIIAINMAMPNKRSTSHLLSYMMIIPLSYVYLRSVASNYEILPYYWGF